MTDADRPRRVVLLGATGSIGRQAQDVVERFPGAFELVGAVARQDVEGLRACAARFGGVRCALVDAPAGVEVPPEWGLGVEAACAVAAMDADVVCVGISGSAALLPTLAAIDRGTDIAIATKEVLVMAGELVTARAAAASARLLPVDSEHSALWQCLRGEEPSAVARLLLTASGGPFRERPLVELATVTVDEALRHPTWSMGPKITVDSATMMNKGLEIIEAHFLFGVPYDRIEVVIHPTSTVHSCVELVDGAVMAQLGRPDMRVPIALALSGGARLPGVGPPLRLRECPPLEFQPVDPERFPAPSLARRAGERGGAAPCVLNAANEAAVAAFLAGSCGFLDIVRLVEGALEDAEVRSDPSLDDLLGFDAWARSRVDAAVMRGRHTVVR
ncbi:MAG TPA: 1-deoxy-D-xylulose-5-phosphate reductoisomerase [Candidatus Dormibacteraeota bacterium]|nr:1-deoxy-D-xylulose-5-phosphate reductoisomerase [Candidatus Dormibacteraeota bacterium]